MRIDEHHPRRRSYRDGPIGIGCAHYLTGAVTLRNVSPARDWPSS